jgi:putative transcriptional regulator
MKTMKNVNLTNHFLIAMPNMVDPNFSRTLTFICEHNDQGALGIVINRPTELNLGSLFKQIDIATPSEEVAKLPVYFGGPVQTDRGFVLHQPIGSWQSTLVVHDSVGLTTSKDILQSVSEGKGPERMLITLGYAGWSAGQLEDEIKANGWLTVEAEPDVIFKLSPEERLPAAMGILGVNYATLSDVAGHA